MNSNHAGKATGGLAVDNSQDDRADTDADTNVTPMKRPTNANTGDVGVRGEQLVLALDGFEGPIDVLLLLARQQKVDLTRISILELSEQYLAYIREVRRRRIELAADYLVMAAWLAYLKSRLLLPAEDEEEEPSGEELAAALALQLRRLEAMRDAGRRLMARDQRGRDFFRRPAAEGVTRVETPIYALTQYDLIKAYADQRRRMRPPSLSITPTRLMSVEAAVRRLSEIIGTVVDWTILQKFLPEALEGDPTLTRSAVASTFVASLELAREGRIDLRQSEAFGPIFVRQSKPRDA